MKRYHEAYSGVITAGGGFAPRRAAVKLNGLLLCSAAAALVLIFSCKTDIGEEKGTLAVQNQSYNPALEITDVWLRNAETMDWVNQWYGSCAGSADYITELSFPVPPGSYDVRIKVNGYGHFYNFYETGYRQSVRIGGGDYKFIIFDGQGIYDMENDG
jgi:hypothetical protein